MLGYKRELEATDLPKMDDTREAGLLADKFEANFARRRKDVEDWNRSLDDGSYFPSSLQKMRWRASAALGLGRADGRREVGMAMALSDTFFWSFWSAGVYKVIGDVAQTTSPLVMRQIIKLVQQSYAAKQAGEPLPGIGRGIGLAIGLFLMQLCVRRSSLETQTSANGHLALAYAASCPSARTTRSREAVKSACWLERR